MWCCIARFVQSTDVNPLAPSDSICEQVPYLIQAKEQYNTLAERTYVL